MGTVLRQRLCGTLVRQREPRFERVGRITEVLLLNNVLERLLRPRGHRRLVGRPNCRWVVRRDRSIRETGLEIKEIVVRRELESQPIRIREAGDLLYNRSKVYAKMRLEGLTISIPAKDEAQDSSSFRHWKPSKSAKSFFSRPASSVVATPSRIDFSDDTHHAAAMLEHCEDHQRR